MADYREQALLELKARVVALKSTIGLKSFERTPSTPVDGKYLPCVYMHEGIDSVETNSSRGVFGFPRRRTLEVEFEVIVNKQEVDIKSTMRNVRSAVFGSTPALAGGKVSIQEIRTEGPTGYGLPDVAGMSLVLAMRYVEESF